MTYTGTSRYGLNRAQPQPTPHQLYSPWGHQPDNDNTRRPRTWPPMIGLTGKRNVGKSTVAAMLEEEYGFERIHAFGAGKHAAAAWFDYVGGDGDRMVWGDLKDQPSEYLPGGVAPRYFLERFGKFMGEEMGVAWTLGLEIILARERNPRAPIVVESVVYEADCFKRLGGTIWRLERPGHRGPVGQESDAEQARIVEDAIISAATVDDLRRQARNLYQQIGGGT